MNRTITLALLLLAGAAAGDEKQKADWVYLDNGTIKLGVLRDRGAGIGWFSESGSGQNLVDHYDHGRLIQQSLYGRPDGSEWNKKPWRWNPVQGGDWKGNPAGLLDFKHDKEKHTIYSRSRGRHWAACRDLGDVVFEQWITLEGARAKIRFRFTYSGEETHPAHHQEIPAVFVAREFDTLVIADEDGELQFSKPKWPNEYHKLPEKWAAYIHPQTEKGIGIKVEKAEQLTCYRFGGGKRDPSSCSYFAPLVTLAITPGMVFEYQAVLTAGKIEEIQERFRVTEKAAPKPSPPGSS